jgi:predicted CXXCH cytochrome family protein
MIRILQQMKQRRLYRFHFLFILLFIGCSLAVSSFSGYQDVSAEQTPAQLSTADCIKCHTAVVQTVDSKGAKHKTAVSCMDCHKGHPPMVSKDKIIPLCSSCHAGKKHYEIGGCNTCHSDPHAPIDMKLGANITGPCLSCHEQQGREVKDHPSLHSNCSVRPATRNTSRFLPVSSATGLIHQKW